MKKKRIAVQNYDFTNTVFSQRYFNRCKIVACFVPEKFLQQNRYILLQDLAMELQLSEADPPVSS